MAKYFDVEGARNAGYTDQEIQSHMASKNLVPKFSVGGFAGNVGRSAVGFGKNILTAIPNLYKMGKNVVTGEQSVGDIGRAIVQSYKDRYGGWDEIARTAYFDPVGTLADVSAVAGAVGGAAKLGGFGKVSSVANKVSRATDPLRVAGKATSVLTKPAQNLFAKVDVPDMLDDASSALAKKSLRPTSTQQENFLEQTGVDIGDYARDMNLQGSGRTAANKIQPIIKSLQAKYNKLARSGQAIDPTDFINQLRKSADDILAKDFSAEAQQVAKNIYDRADLMETKAIEYMVKNNTRTIPIDILTETKGSAFSKVPKDTMADPSRMHGGKIAGGVGIAQLEKFAPGTQQLGKAQQAALAFQDIAKQQAGLGKGTQLINLVKPSGGGAVLGGVLGGAPGAVAGAGASMLLNSPKFLAGASKVLHKGAQITRNAKVPSYLNRASQFGKGAYEVSKYARPITSQAPQLKPQTPLQRQTLKKLPYNQTLPPTIQKNNIPTAEQFYAELRKRRGY